MVALENEEESTDATRQACTRQCQQSNDCDANPDPRMVEMILQRAGPVCVACLLERCGEIFEIELFFVRMRIVADQFLSCYSRFHLLYRVCVCKKV